MLAILLVRSTAENPHTNLIESRKALLAFKPPPVPDEENAALEYEKAFKLFVSYGKLTGKESFNDDRIPQDPVFMLGVPASDLDQPQVQQFLNANIASYAWLDAAMLKSKINWGHDYMLPAGLGNDNRYRLLDASRRMSLRALVRARAGDHAGAAHDLKAIWIFASHVDSDGFLFDKMMGESFRSIAITCMQLIVLYYTPQRAEDIETYRDSFGPLPDPRASARQVALQELANTTYIIDWFAETDEQTLHRMMSIPLFGADPIASRLPYAMVYGSDRKALIETNSEALECAKRDELAPDDQELWRKHQHGPVVFAKLYSVNSGIRRIQLQLLKEADTLQCMKMALIELAFRARNGKERFTLDDRGTLVLKGTADFSTGRPLAICVDTQELVISARQKVKYPAGTIRVYSFGMNGEDDYGQNSWSIGHAGKRDGDDPCFILPPLKAKQP
ncbi:MAG TPA: hypothetical protein VKX17_09650 [Planctomycetota bacterium]|nr:hypothetical protein [Planctomycetota bacterium]